MTTTYGEKKNTQDDQEAAETRAPAFIGKWWFVSKMFKIVHHQENLKHDQKDMRIKKHDQTTLELCPLNSK